MASLRSAALVLSVTYFSLSYLTLDSCFMSVNCNTENDFLFSIKRLGVFFCSHGLFILCNVH